MVSSALAWAVESGTFILTILAGGGGGGGGAGAGAVAGGGAACGAGAGGFTSGAFSGFGAGFSSLTSGATGSGCFSLGTWATSSFFDDSSVFLGRVSTTPVI